jgi:hypothetical protein
MGIKANINRGIKRLDEMIPNWFKKIDAEELHMCSDSACIAGQLGKGDPYKTLKKLKLNYNDGDAEKYGFMPDRHEEGEAAALWKKAIAKRLKDGGVVKATAAEKEKPKKAKPKAKAKK